jgi:methylase of polypeptide subunit release factors
VPDAAPLRAALLAADYTTAGVDALLGPVAHAALGRGDLLPATRATAGGDPLSTLVRLFLLGAAVPLAAASAAIPLAEATALQLVERFGDEVRARLDVRPYGADEATWWVVSDLGADVRPGPLPHDHVLGVGGASTTLAQSAVRPVVARAVDVGTGSGVQALHLSTHAATVVATDRNPRALRLAALTAALNERTWDLRLGSLYDPVRGDEPYDLVVSNPPFVVGPPRDDVAYRDSGLAGDDVTAALLRGAADVVADDGWVSLLGNWLHVAGGPDWRERVTSWVPAGFDAWVVQREVQDPAEYVALWRRDAAQDRDGTPADAWLDWFAAAGVEAVGFGLVTLHRSGAATPVVVAEEARQPVTQPLGPHVTSWFDRQDWLRAHPDLLSAHLSRAADLHLGQDAVAGANGWEVVTQVLRLDSGFRWQGEVDQLTVELVAGCDGRTPLRDVLALLAAAHGYREDELSTGALPAVRHLIERGLLLPRPHLGT